MARSVTETFVSVKKNNDHSKKKQRKQFEELKNKSIVLFRSTTIGKFKAGIIVLC